VLRVDLLGVDGLVLVGGGRDGLVGETMEVVAARRVETECMGWVSPGPDQLYH
jgi:hypothetical protein